MLATVIQNHQRQISGGIVSLTDLRAEKKECLHQLGNDISMKERKQLELLCETLTSLIEVHEKYQIQ